MTTGRESCLLGSGSRENASCNRSIVTGGDHAPTLPLSASHRELAVRQVHRVHRDRWPSRGLSKHSSVHRLAPTFLPPAVNNTTGISRCSHFTSLPPTVNNTTGISRCSPFTSLPLTSKNIRFKKVQDENTFDQITST